MDMSDSFVTPWTVARSSVRGISQARILEWVAIPSPGDLPDPGIEPGSPSLQPDTLLSEPPGKPSQQITCNETSRLKPILRLSMTISFFRSFPSTRVEYVHI